MTCRLHLSACISLALSIFTCTKLEAASAPAACQGIFSAKASRLPASHAQPDWQLASPDGKLQIREQEGELVLQGKDGQSTRLGIMAQPDLTEVLWSADSRYLAINTSDGGSVGTWEAKLFAIDAQGLPAALGLQDVLMKASAKYPRCKPQEAPNLAALAWSNEEVLLLAEVPPHSSCRNMGQITGFRFALKSKKLMAVVPEKTLRARQPAVLGCRFSRR